MELHTLSLTQFRNYLKRSFSFSPGTTLILGPNTTGKTSILEAIMLIASGKSFRAEKEEEMIRNVSEVGRVNMTIGAQKEAETTKQLDVVEVVLTPGVVHGRKTPHKIFTLNGVSKRQSSIVGLLPTVLFWPEDLNLILGSPSKRRRYLDNVLSQTDRAYDRALGYYEKALRIRNKLLRLLRDSVHVHQDEMVFWEDQLIQNGTIIHELRRTYLHDINRYTLSSVPSGIFHAVYDHSIISRSRLDTYFHEERSAGITLVGPHRDDIVVYKGKTENSQEQLHKYGSRGEQRMGVLWLKLAELSYMKKLLQVKPLFLLDDILSELDKDHRRLVGGVISHQQCIITSAEKQAIPDQIRKNAQIIELGKL
jgi:DNA replication and repair protein RecF